MKIGKIELGIFPVVAGIITKADTQFSDSAAGLVDVFEIRADMFENHSPFHLKEIIDKMKTIYGKPIILTVRAAAEGGANQLGDDERSAIFNNLIPYIDAIDVELASGDLIENVLPDCRARGKLLILSYHNFVDTPEISELETILQNGKKSGADIVKIAVTPKNTQNVSDLISFTINNKDKGIITISMGSLGLVSRVVNPILGSLIAYAYLDRATAPGQISAQEITADLRRYSPAYDENHTA